MIPIICRPLEGGAVPEQLARLNYIYLYSDPQVPGSDFSTGISRLAEAIRADLDWTQEHTRLLLHAKEWDMAARAEYRLLKGLDVPAARAWLDRWPRSVPKPSDLVIE